MGKPFEEACFDDPAQGRRAYDNVENGEYDSVVGDRTWGAGTFREFVVYHEDQLYLEYMVLYERIYKDPAFGRSEVKTELTVEGLFRDLGLQQ